MLFRSGTTNIVSRMNAEDLHSGYRRILERIYAPSHYYKRVRTFLREYRAPQVKARLQWQDVMAFLRSTVRLGIIERGRMQYWKLMIWTQIFRPQHFGLAVTLAIFGHHFQVVSRQRVG